MNKVSKILLGGVVGLSSIMFMTNVKADGGIIDQLTEKGKVEYQVYNNGSSIMYDKTYNYECTGSTSTTCKSYTISEDDGISDSTIKLTSGSEEFEIGKDALAAGYIVSANKNIEIYLDGENKSDEISGTVDDITKLKYFKRFDDVASLIKNAKQFDNIYLGNVNDLSYTDFVIPKDVTVTGLSAARNIINNGKIKTSMIGAKKISGTGSIDLLYNIYIGSWAGEYTPVNDATRFSVTNISGVKVNVLNTTIKEGMSFGEVGTTTGYTKEEAQKVIDMYNNVLGTSMNGYKLKLAKYKVEGDNEYYYGELQKVEETKNTSKTNVATKTQVKNPKTGDNILYIGLITIASVLGIGYGAKKFAKQK